MDLGRSLRQALAKFTGAPIADEKAVKALSRELGRNPSVAEILGGWQASGAIREQREFQELLAVEHCSFPQLIPERLRLLSAEDRTRKLEELRFRLRL